MIRQNRHQQTDMNPLQKQLVSGSKHVKLTQTEHTLMREHLVSYMQYKPLRKPEPVAQTGAYFSVLNFFKARHLSGALMIALIASTSTYSVSSAAADALPGDFLWPVKVHINEEVRTVFASGDEEKIAWETERAEIRLEEAGALAAQGRLDTERQEVVAKQFTAHTDAIVEKVRKVEQSDPILAAEASAELADALDTHKAVLARLVVEQEAAGNTAGSARELVKEVHRAAHEAEALRDETEDKLALSDDIEEDVQSVAASESTGTEDTEPAADPSEDVAAVVSEDQQASEVGDVRTNQKRAAVRAQDRANSLAGKAGELVATRPETDELKERAQQTLRMGGELLAGADAAFAEGRFGKAYTGYRSAASAFHKTMAFLEAADTYTSDVSVSMLEELPSTETEEPSDGGDTEVPSTPPATPEEESAKEVRELDEGTQVNIGELRAQIAAFAGNEEIKQQLRTLANDADASMLRAEMALSVGDTTEAQQLYAQANRQANRIMLLLEEEGAVEVTTEQEQKDEDETVDEAQHTAPTLIQHRASGTTHFVSGTYANVPTCATLDAQLTTAELPQTVLTLALQSITEDNAPCTDTATQAVGFEASTTASPSAQLVEVTYNGEPILWALDSEEPAETARSDSFESVGRSVFQRAIDSTNTIFNRQ